MLSVVFPVRPEEFIIPDFDAPLDVEAAIARTPDRVTTKGMFNTAVAKAALRVAPSRGADLFEGCARTRWAPFLEYPLKAHMRLLFNAANLGFRGLPIREGLRRLGWSAFQTFSDSMAGKIVLGATGVGIDGVLGIGGRAISMCVSDGAATAKRVAEHHWLASYTDVYCFLDSYHVGIIEGVLRAFGRPGDVRVCLRTPIEGTFDIRW